jgi:hypothetical protein
MLELGRDERDIAEVANITVETVRFLARIHRNLTVLRASDGTVMCTVIKQRDRKMPPGRVPRGVEPEDLVRFPRPAPSIRSLRREFVRDFFTMSHERRVELRAALEAYAREIRPLPDKSRRATKSWKTEITLRLAGEHCWGLPERIMMEMLPITSTETRS